MMSAFTVSAKMAAKILVTSSTIVTEGNSTPASQNRRKFKHQSTNFPYVTKEPDK